MKKYNTLIEPGTASIYHNLSNLSNYHKDIVIKGEERKFQ